MCVGGRACSSCTWTCHKKGRQSVFILHIDVSQKRQAERVHPAHGRVTKKAGRACSSCTWTCHQKGRQSVFILHTWTCHQKGRQSVLILHMDVSQKRQAERVHPAHGRVTKKAGRACSSCTWTCQSLHVVPAHGRVKKATVRQSHAASFHIPARIMHYALLLHICIIA